MEHSEILLGAVVCLIASLMGLLILYIYKEKQKNEALLEPYSSPEFDNSLAHLIKGPPLDANATIFCPDQVLLRFAEQFSNDYRTLSEGIYTTKPRFLKYKINYCQFDGNPPFRINVNLNEVRFSKNQLLSGKDYCSDYIFFLVLWSFCMIALKRYHTTMKVSYSSETGYLLHVDIMTMAFYLSTGRKVKPVFQSFMSMLKMDIE